MPRVTFTAHLAQIGPGEERRVGGQNVAAALDAVFADFPRLRGYILDDQGHPRRHIIIFVDGEHVPNPVVLAHAVTPDSEIYVLQALSGGEN